jgi:uncharacterized protein
MKEKGCDLSEDQIETIKTYLLKKVEPYVIILFGSAAQERLRQDSDLDLAFLSDRRFSAYELFMVAQELADLMKRDVDLIDLNKASTVLKAQIVGTGKVLLNRDDYRRMVFQMDTLKEYASLNEERQLILENFKKRGLSYAK